MANSWRQFQTYLYLVFLAVGIVLLLITINDLIIQNASVSGAGFSLKSLGPWEMWVFVLAIILTAAFSYFFFKVTSETKRFTNLIQSSSKHNFVKNLKELEKISRNLGPKYQELLEESMQKWKVK